VSRIHGGGDVDMRRLIAGVTIALVGAVALPADAQEWGASDNVEAAPHGTVRAPKNATEIDLGGGYTQAFGKLGGNTNMSDIARGGGAVTLEVAYRVSPRFSIGGFGELHANATDSTLGPGSSVAGLATGALAGFHFLPYRLIDPFVSAGIGYRALRIASRTSPAGIVHGIDALKANVGIDVRVDKGFALGPRLGADVNVFLAKQMGGPASDIEGKGVSTFIYAGVGGRLDIFGSRVPELGHRVALRADASASE